MCYNILVKKLTKKEKSELVYTKLDSMFHGRTCELNFSNTFELLIAVILSAQCTDKRVNLVTEQLFKKYKTAEDFANLDNKTLEREIYSCGFYRNKANNIILCCKDLIKRFKGVVPSDFDDLVSLAGVGRKTANVVLAFGFNTPAFPVDTHVFRVSNRLGLSESKTPDKCEEQMTKLIDRDKWSSLHHFLVLYGRYCCKAIKPNCQECEFKEICKYYENRRK